MLHKTSELGPAVSDAADFLDLNAILANVVANVEREAAMRARWVGRRVMPCSLADEKSYEAGHAWMARDVAGALFLIGSDPEKAVRQQTLRP